MTLIRFDSKGVEVTTDGGTLRAQRAVIATGSASPFVKPLERHLRQMQTYAVIDASARSEDPRRAWTARRYAVGHI